MPEDLRIAIENLLLNDRLTEEAKFAEQTAERYLKHSAKLQAAMGKILRTELAPV